MKNLTAAILAAATLLPAIATAQIKTLPGETKTVTATVDAIEIASRSLTLKKPDNTTVTTKVPPEFLRFDQLKVGDKLAATYYDNIVLRVKAPGEKDVDTASGSLVPTPGLKPGFTIGAQTGLQLSVLNADDELETTVVNFGTATTGASATIYW